MEFTVASANTDNIEDHALSQEGNPQTHTDTLRDLGLQHMFDFSQQDYQV